MDLSIQKLSKAFNQKKVFSNISLEIHSGSRLAITGSNGSGKSTLLKILSGGQLPSAGKIIYHLNGILIPEDQVFRYVHVVAPYNTVIEELTLPELFSMHQKLGTLLHFQSCRQWMDALQYSFPWDHRIKTFSSGMKQRVKLGLAMLDSRPLILLDEPGTNLDSQGKEWFFTLFKMVSARQTIIIATNDQQERAICDQELQVEAYSQSGN